MDASPGERAPCNYVNEADSFTNLSVLGGEGMVCRHTKRGQRLVCCRCLLFRVAGEVANEENLVEIGHKGGGTFEQRYRLCFIHPSGFTRKTVLRGWHVPT